MAQERESRRRRRPVQVMRWWWRQPDQFNWITGYLHARELARPARQLMAVVSIVVVFMGAGVLPSRGHTAAVSLAMCIAALAVGAGFAMVWIKGWPSRFQSLAMAFIGSAGVALGSVMQPQPMLALLGCTGLTGIGGYLALFHNSKAFTANIAIALTAGAVCAVRLAAETHDIVLAGAAFALVADLNVAVPLAMQSVMRALGTDVVRSDHDPLTGVLNRRAFYERATALLTSPAADQRLIVMMIDLDSFKQLNDTYGHLAGDQALTAVGWVLRENTSSSAVVARFGGEEFVVVDFVASRLVEEIPERLCAAVAALPQPVTASVGAAVVEWVSMTDPARLIAELIRAADSTMYSAKVNGGNQWRISRPSVDGRPAGLR